MPTKPNYQGNQQNYDPKNGEYEQGPKGAFSNFGNKEAKKKGHDVQVLGTSKKTTTEQGHSSVFDYYEKNKDKIANDPRAKAEFIEELQGQLEENERDIDASFDEDEKEYIKGQSKATQELLDKLQSEEEPEKEEIKWDKYNIYSLLGDYSKNVDEDLVNAKGLDKQKYQAKKDYYEELSDMVNELTYYFDEEDLADNFKYELEDRINELDETLKSNESEDVKAVAQGQKEAVESVLKDMGGNINESKPTEENTNKQFIADFVNENKEMFGEDLEYDTDKLYNIVETLRKENDSLSFEETFNYVMEYLHDAEGSIDDLEKELQNFGAESVWNKF